MVVFATEFLCQVIDEVKPMLHAHHAEVPQDGIEVRPRWKAYAAMEQAGMFRVFTAREEGKLVGYNGVFLLDHWHDDSAMVATSDVLYIDPQHRNGFTVRRFLRYCEQQVKAAGMKRLAYFASPQNNLAPLLHHMGYASEQVMVAKTL